MLWCFFFFFKQKTAYEMRISDWSSDVCSSDLICKRRTFDIQILGVEPDRACSACRRTAHQFSVQPAFDHRRAASHGHRPPICQTVRTTRPHGEPACHLKQRSEERRAGKECVSTCRSRSTPYHLTTTLTSSNHLIM